MNMKDRIRTIRNSLFFRLLLWFMLFAALLISLIWLLQTVLIDHYYEDMKLKEIESEAKALVKGYKNSRSDHLLQKQVDEYCAVSDTFIRIEDDYGKAVVVPVFSGGNTPTYYYSIQAGTLKDELVASGDKKISHINTTTYVDKEKRTLTYATYLYEANDSLSESDNRRNTRILFIFSPLYPVSSTLAIFQTQLVYITVIALLLALGMGFYMAYRISKPIRALTDAAAEMGKANYSVKFRGGSYSEIRHLADTLTTASRELEKTDQYQKDLVANVSHDLRTPLTMIRSYAEMVRDLSGDNPEKRNKHLDVIIEETERLNTLVEDMLTLSRMQRRKIVLDRTDFDLVECVKRLLHSYEIFSHEEGYSFYFEASDPIIVNGDAVKIRQVISNLVNNAIKYCGEDKTIMINLNKAGKAAVRLEVTDHGQGIPEDEINHVWERYYKASTHHVRPTDGSGLGLSIVKEILDLHKTEYGVESEAGEGSTFWFELPLAKSPSGR